MVEVARAGIRLVAEHHARPLTVGHCVRARVGQQVDVDVLGAEEERVEARVGQRTVALGATSNDQRLDDLDLPGFCPTAAAH
jgi:hypothetical protein